jgi:hypothetical protein
MIWIKGVETSVVRVSVNGHIYGVYNLCKCKWFTLTRQFFIHLHLHYRCVSVFLSCLDLAIMVFFCLFTYFSRWWNFESSMVSSLKHLLLCVCAWFCSYSLLFSCVALLLFIIVCVCRFQKLGRGKLDTRLSLTHGGTHRAHHFLQVSKAMP